MSKRTSVILLCISILMMICIAVVAIQLKIGLDEIEEARKNHDSSEDLLPGLSVFSYVSAYISLCLVGGVLAFMFSCAGAVVSGINIKKAPARAIKGVSIGLFVPFALVILALIGIVVYFWASALF